MFLGRRRRAVMAFLATLERPMPAHFYVFDLEMVGTTNPDQCRIWDVALLHWPSRRLFTATVDPAWTSYPPPPHPDLFPVTSTFLKTSGARPFAAVATDIRAFVRATAGSGAVPTAWVSHGCHLLDKPVLEREFARLGQALPGHWYFYDTLPFFRKRYRRQASYKLGPLFTSVFGRPPPRCHRAVDDVWTLTTLLTHATFGGNTRWLTGGYYPPLLTPLQTVRYIGTQGEALLHAAGYTCVEDLVVLLAKTCGLHEPTLRRHFQARCHLPRAAAHRIARSVLHTVLRRTAGGDDTDADAAVTGPL